MALTNNKTPTELNRYKFTTVLFDSRLGNRHALYKPPRFRKNFDYVSHTVMPQDIGRLDLLSMQYYSVPYLWWAIAWVNNIGNPLTDLHTAGGERSKATVAVVNTGGNEALVFSSKLVGDSGNLLNVEVGPGTLRGFQFIVRLSSTVKVLYDNVLLIVDEVGNLVGVRDNDFVSIELLDATLDLLPGLYVLIGGESWAEQQVLKIPSRNEVEYALSNSESSD